jgi:hypothetical protein
MQPHAAQKSGSNKGQQGLMHPRAAEGIIVIEGE